MLYIIKLIYKLLIRIGGVIIKNLFRMANTFMVRTPSLPMNLYYSLMEENLSDEKIIKDMPSKYKEIFEEGVLTSSRDFYNSLKMFINGNAPKNLDNFYNSLYKYFIRSSSRCTPFGTVAGIDFGTYSAENTKFELNDDNFIRYAKPDMEWLMGYIKKIEKEKGQKLRYKVNEAITIRSGRVFLDDSGKSNIQYSKPVEVVLANSKDYITFDELICVLQGNFKGQSKQLLERFVLDLIDNNYLISDLRPSLTCRNQFERFINKFENYNIDKSAAEKLRDILKEINDYNQTTNDATKKYEDIINAMSDVFKAKNYLHVDIGLNFKNKNLNYKFEDDINALINILMAFSSETTSTNTMKDYKAKFLDRYGENRVVPIAEVIDSDVGIGTALLENHELSNSYKNLFSNDIIQYFNLKYYESLQQGLNTIEVRDDDLENIGLSKYRYKDLPNSLELSFSMMKENNEYLFEISDTLGSTRAGKSFGRFSRMMKDPTEFFKHINENDESLGISKNDYVFCEVSLMPDDFRSANVINNEHGSDYEISLSATNSKDKEHQIELKDIFVGIENDSFYLFSKRLNKRITVTINNMFNPSMCPDIVKFLYAITTDNMIKWYITPWNYAFSNFVYVPQLRYKNFILSQERWSMNNKILGMTNKPKFEEFNKKFLDYKEKYKLPKYVYCGSNDDNKLLLNLNNTRCRKILYNEVCVKKQNISLKKFDHTLECPISYNGSNYCGEVFIPLLKNQLSDVLKKDKRAAMNPVRNFMAVDLDDIQTINNVRTKRISNENIPTYCAERTKKPFDNWLYFNIYENTKMTERFISTEMNTFLENLRNQGKINKYFFIRYIDPKNHIRLRICADKDKLISIYPEIDKWLESMIEKNYILRFTIDCYDREIERYGGSQLIDLAENVFCEDSYVCSKILEYKVNKRLSISNELIALTCIVDYLDKFGLSTSEKMDFLEKNISMSTYRDEFRKNRNQYIQAVACQINGQALNESHKFILECCELRRNSIDKYIKKLNEMFDDRNIKFELLNSFIHMNMNRLFGTDVRFELKSRSIARHTMYAVIGMNHQCRILKEKNIC